MLLKRQTNWISSVIMIMTLMVSNSVEATSDFQMTNAYVELRSEVFSASRG